MIEGPGNKFIARPIQRIGDLGSLDRVFDLAEQRIHGGEFAIGLAEYESETGEYEVSSPLSKSVAYRVRPDLFHGFIEMRYQQLALTGADRRAGGMSLGQFLGVARAAVSGNWEGLQEVDDAPVHEWLVKRKGGLYRPVNLGGTAWINEPSSSLLIAWDMTQFKGGGANG